MKIITRFFTLSLLAAAIIIPFFLKTENGRPTLATPTASDFIPDQLMPESMKEKTTTTTQSAKQTFFKWQDAQGMWHYGDRPPAGSKNITNVSVNTNANIIQAIKIENPLDKVTPLQKAEPKVSDTLADGKLTIDDAMNVMNDASAVRDMMENRNEQLKAITGVE